MFKTREINLEFADFFFLAEDLSTNFNYVLFKRKLLPFLS